MAIEAKKLEIAEAAARRNADDVWYSKVMSAGGLGISCLSFVISFLSFRQKMKSGAG
jgi:hypothetical protein